VATRDSKRIKPTPEKTGGRGIATSDSTGKKTPVKREKALLGCFRRRETWVPTWRGFLLLCLILALLVIAGIASVHPFLAPNHPIPGGILVVEGWGPDYAMAAAAEEFSHGHYDRLYVTGGPLEQGGDLSEFKTFAELGAATLLKMGLTTNVVQAVPAPLVQADRTYNSALALRKYLGDHATVHPTLNLMSIGPHARRSRLLYEKVFGESTKIGIVALPPHDYNPKRWWRSSAGVRTVLSEVFAYVYARFFFHPSTEVVTAQ